jgi:uncharacterized damage-inducible protein DinB
MGINQGFIQELEQEAATTRRVLERVPGDRLSWKPHAKSMSLGQLALHIATNPGTIAQMATLSSVPVPDFAQAEAKSVAEILSALDATIVTAKTVLEGLDDNAMGEIWKAMAGDQVVMAVPRAGILRSIMLNHWYHHRGQLSVYLRLLDVPVPSIYGPSADDNPFAG